MLHTGYLNYLKDYDATVAEINPLVLTRSGELVAADCRVTIDDNSLYRHPDVKAPRDIGREFTEIEKRIWSFEEKDPRGTGYFIQLVQDTRGCVGFHGIGGGGAMLAADALLKRNVKIANYADTSGDPPASKVYRVVKTILSQPGIVGYVLIGSTLASQEQWHHAHAIVKALNEMLKDKPGFPVVILLAGNKEAEAHEIIRRGLKNLPVRMEIYGRDYIYETDFIADRVKELVNSYLG
jgi:succinyl-CoA synthetase beta subunit